MGLFKRIAAGILTAALTLSVGAVGAFAAESSGEFTLGIYFTADLYGAWYSVDPNTDQPVDANYLKVAAVMSGQAKRNDAQLLIDAGNSLHGPSATYCMNLERRESEPIALSLRYAGYDAFLPGSAERSLRLETRKVFYSSLTDAAGTLSGSSVAVLQSGVDTGEGEWREDKTAPFMVRSFLAAGREFRVALVSLETAGDWLSLRQSQSCDLVVGIAPSGVPSESISTILAGTAGIDLVLMNGGGVSGIITPRDIQGKRVPVVRGGGSVLTRAEVNVDKNGAFSINKSEGIDLENRRNDDNLGALLAPYYENAKTYGSQTLGVLSGSWPWEPDLSTAQSDTMNLIHESQLWAAQAEVSIAAPQSEGDFCIRQLLEEQRFATVDRRTCWAIYPRENDRLLAVEMTGMELKQWLENSAAQYTLEEDGSISGWAGASQVYGISYTFCLGNPPGDRVMNMTFQGAPVGIDQTFRVAVSEGSLSAAKLSRDAYPIQWEAANSDTFRSVGGSVTWIIGEYIRSLSAEYRQVLPPKARSRWTITGATVEKAMSKVTRLEFVKALHVAAGSPKTSVCAFFSDIRRTGLEQVLPTALDWAVETGVVQGNGGGKFLPDEPITREQASIMLLRFDTARGQGPQGAWATAVPYTDAADVVSWASEALMWNVLKNYLPPDDGGYFRPQAAVTAVELEQILELLAQP